MRNSNYGPGLQNNNNGAGLQNIHIVHNSNSSEFDIYKTLCDAISGVGATHDAEQQYERGECLLRTREKAIERILNWVMSPGEHPILWLTGAAGVGKTAIAITVAKLCQEHDRLVTSFFFFRADPKRNNPFALVLTIVYGLITAMLPLCAPIEERILRDRMILEARMEDQFRELVVKPLGHQQALPSPQPPGSSKKLTSMQTGGPPYLVIIDGLDECGDEETQKRILSTIQSAFEHSASFRLRFLICSRPESWLRYTFNSQSLQSLHECVVLDESFKPDEDIEYYYLHHFREIVGNPEYTRVVFPSPWPSKKDLGTLIEWTSGQFIYAATVIKFLKLASRHPITQLRIILERIPNLKPGPSPYRQLDLLYDVIFASNTDHEGIILILAAILVLPGYLPLTPVNIELVLGLPQGQVDLTLRGMHSVLDIRGSNHEIRFFHNSFREYLIDASRSGSFHIDQRTWRYIIARSWSQNLSTKQIQGYSPSQLWEPETELFYTGWTKFCMSLPIPTRELLDDLRCVDLASVCAHESVLRVWEERLKDLVPWLRKYKTDVKGSGNALNKKETKGRTKTGQPSHLSINRQSGIEARGRETARGRDSLDFVETLVRRFQNRPRCFHLEWPPGLSPPDDVVYYIVNRAASCPRDTRLNGSRPSAVNDIRLTDCHCDLSGRKGSRDPWHVAYQEACLKLVKAYISLFEELSRSRAKDEDTVRELRCIFMNLTWSSLLEHCHLDMELISLFHSFLRFAKGYSTMSFHRHWGEELRKNMFKWFETFPSRFATERKSLKAQLLGLPWERWDRNIML